MSVIYARVMCTHVCACACVCMGEKQTSVVLLHHSLSYESLTGPGMNCQPENPSDPPVSDPTARIAAVTPAAMHGF